MAEIEPRPEELKRCIQDLIALSARAYEEPVQVLGGLASALMPMLGAEFVYAVGHLPGGEPVAVLRSSPRLQPAADALRGAIEAWTSRRDHQASLADPLTGDPLRIALAPIGFAGGALLAAGSAAPGFPTEIQRLRLRFAADGAAAALHRWCAETEDRRLAALVERSSDFIGYASLDGSPQYLNPAGMKLMGLESFEEVRRLNIVDFVTAEQQAHVRTVLFPLVMKAGRWQGQLSFRHFRTGARIPFLVDWFRIDHPRTGEPVNIATVSRDLTPQKRAEADLRHLNDMLARSVARRTAERAALGESLGAEARERHDADQRLRQLQSELFHASRLSTAGQMAGAIAHELNQPLTAAINSVNAARLLADKLAASPGEVQSVLDEAAGQIVRAGEITRRLREFVVSGKGEQRTESLASLVEEATGLALGGSEGAGATASLRLDPAVANVFADRIQIQQVLVNLFRNALDAMAGRPRQRLVVTTALLDPSTVEVSVADNGPGLGPNSPEQLFEPFFSTKPHGMGLGLSISRSIVEAHGGALWGEPNPRGGAVFRFTLRTSGGAFHG